MKGMWELVIILEWCQLGAVPSQGAISIPVQLLAVISGVRGKLGGNSEVARRGNGC